MNLIIVTTPFQMIIAEKIMQIYPQESFHLIVLTSYDNCKYKYYYERVSKKCKMANYIKTLPMRKSKLFTLFDLFHIKLLSLFLPKYKKIFLANIECIRVKTLISRFFYADIYTFDDGTANITYNSYLYNETKANKLLKFVLMILGSDFSMARLKERSLLHFSIYKDKKNIINNVKYINLISDYNIKELGKEKLNNKIPPIKLFIGQPVYEISPRLYDDIDTILNQFNIKYYYPHPRELYKKNVEYIDSEFILEDYIISYISKGYYFEIYTLFSGSILNMMNLNNVKLYSVRTINVTEEFKGVYDIFKENNITVIDL